MRSMAGGATASGARNGVVTSRFASPGASAQRSPSSATSCEVWSRPRSRSAWAPCSATLPKTATAPVAATASERSLRARVAQVEDGEERHDAAHAAGEQVERRRPAAAAARGAAAASTRSGRRGRRCRAPRRLARRARSRAQRPAPRARRPTSHVRCDAWASSLAGALAPAPQGAEGRAEYCDAAGDDAAQRAAIATLPIATERFGPTANAYCRKLGVSSNSRRAIWSPSTIPSAEATTPSTSASNSSTRSDRARP